MQMACLARSLSRIYIICTIITVNVHYTVIDNDSAPDNCNASASAQGAHRPTAEVSKAVKQKNIF